jgi:hypothetical protein
MRASPESVTGVEVTLPAKPATLRLLDSPAAALAELNRLQLGRTSADRSATTIRRFGFRPSNCAAKRPATLPRGRYAMRKWMRVRVCSTSARDESPRPVQYYDPDIRMGDGRIERQDPFPELSRRMTHADDAKTGFRLRAIAVSIATVALLAAAYVFGAYSYSHRIFPIDALRDLEARLSERPSAAPLGTYDSFGRLMHFPGKTEVDCPAPKPQTAVLLAIGQSNVANHGAATMRSRHPDRVLNYHDGKCYAASSPLLGATGEQGEFVTPLADALVTSGTFETVIIIASGIGNTPISRWQQDGDLNDMLLATLARSKAQYEVTHVIWHQGESDFFNRTSAKVYARSFRSLLSTLEILDIRAPIFIAIATKCGRNPEWIRDNPTAIGQRSLIDGERIFLGADTDALLTAADREPGGCHLSEAGQRRTATAFARAIADFEQRDATRADSSA